jgi:hypothetical protein
MVGQDSRARCLGSALEMKVWQMSKSGEALSQVSMTVEYGGHEATHIPSPSAARPS